MLRHSAGLCFLISGLVGFIFGDEPEKPDPRTEIATVIPYAITLLEAKKYEQFIKEIAKPGEATKMEKDFAEDGGFANGAKLWGQSLGPFTLRIFKEIKALRVNKCSNYGCDLRGWMT